MTTLHTAEICERMVAQIKAATLSFGPLAICQVGDLSHYPENPDLDSDVPAVFVQPITTGVMLGDIGGEQVDQDLTLRVLLVNKWDEATTNLVLLKMRETDELVDKTVIRDAGDDWRLGDTLTDTRIDWALPTQVEYVPGEHAQVAMDQKGNARRLYATAFLVQVKAVSAR